MCAFVVCFGLFADTNINGESRLICPRPRRGTGEERKRVLRSSESSVQTV